MKYKKGKQTSALTWIGVILIVAGFVFAGISGSQSEKSDEIKAAVESSLSYYYRSDGYELSVRYKSDGKYNTEIHLSAEDEYLFSDASQCGLIATNFLQTMKQYHPTEDGYTGTYYFQFIADGKETYSAVYRNSATDEIALALKDGDTEYPAKTYEEYLTETRSEQALALGMSQETYDELSPSTLSTGETSYVVTEKEDGSYTILPRNETYNVRNAGSSLLQYEHDYCADYFIISDLAMKTDRTESTLSLMLTNTSDQDYTDVFVYCDFIDEDGIVIDQDIASVQNLISGQSYRIELSDYFGSGNAATVNFRISEISIYTDKSGSRFTFD